MVVNKVAIGERLRTASTYNAANVVVCTIIRGPSRVVNRYATSSFVCFARCAFSAFAEGIPWLAYISK